MHDHFPIVKICSVIEEFFETWSKLEQDYSQALMKANEQMDKWLTLVRYFEAETLAMPSPMTPGGSRIISVDHQRLSSFYDELVKTV